MTALLNLVVPAIVVLAALAGYRDWAKHRKYARVLQFYVIPVILLLYVYQVIQPSYMPKGSVPDMRRMPIEYTERVTEDRLKKPRHTTEEREERLEELLDYREKVDEILKD